MFFKTGAATLPTVGANQTWDYSTISLTSSGTGVFTDPATLPLNNRTNYPTATNVVVWDGAPNLDVAITDVYFENADSLVYLAQTSSGGGAGSKKGGSIGKWKLNFNESKKGLYYSQLTGQLTPSDYKYDGYGTLITPKGTYNDAVMISFELNKVIFQTKPFFAPIIQFLYSSSSAIGAMYVNSYESDPSGIQDEASLDASISFSSTDKHLYFNFKEHEGVFNVRLVDLTGKTSLATSLNSTSGVQSISTENLKSGIYLVEIIYGSKSKTSKLFLTN
jgi:hypothetical protein